MDDDQYIEEARAVFGEYSSRDRYDGILLLLTNLRTAVGLLDREQPMRPGQPNSDRFLEILRTVYHQNNQASVGPTQLDLGPRFAAYFAAETRRFASRQAGYVLDPDPFV